ncbi:MAG: alpha/beta hydrolase [Candidatus Binataceae bacterium]
MNRSDQPSLAASAHIDTGDFLLPGSGLSALLIHGLSGTPYEMRYLAQRLAGAGMRVRAVKLAGHAASPEDLAASDADGWYASAVAGFEQLRGFGDPIVVVGLSAGALLGAKLTVEQPGAIAGLVMLSPAFYLPRAAASALRVVGMLGAIASRLYVASDGSDIQDAAARRVHPSLRMMPLNAPIELLRLSAAVRPMLSRITQPVLVIHSRLDHTCPMDRNVGFVTSHLKRARVRSVILEQGYHVITVDLDKERVAAEVLAFALHLLPAQSQPNSALDPAPAR